MRVRTRQQGQALIYGLFMLVAGLAATYLLFNVGQLTREKTKLVNATDAVAYSAGVMHARALNFASYTNRALVANEVAIAQTVSLASWGKYLEQHGESALGLGCTPDTYYMTTEPAWEGMVTYALVCIALGTASEYGALTYVNKGIQAIGQATMVAAETSKTMLKGAQTIMMATLPAARNAVMQEVADANYSGDGTVEVDLVPLRDTFYAFGGGPITDYYTGDRRVRMRDFVKEVVEKDGFTPERDWSDTAKVPSCVDASGVKFNYVERKGGTKLQGFDRWQAHDEASYHRWHLVKPRFGIPYCSDSPQTLANADQSASAGGSTSASSDDWSYSGIPSYAELSEAALAAEDPRAQFAIRLKRSGTQTRTSDARADIKTTPRLNAYRGAPAGGLYVGLAASEVFFSRPVGRADGKKELASLFNPYWQVHLMEVPDEVRSAAQALQGAVTP